MVFMVYLYKFLRNAGEVGKLGGREIDAEANSIYHREMLMG